MKGKQEGGRREAMGDTAMFELSNIRRDGFMKTQLFPLGG